MKRVCSLKIIIVFLLFIFLAGCSKNNQPLNDNPPLKGVLVGDISLTGEDAALIETAIKQALICRGAQLTDKNNEKAYSFVGQVSWVPSKDLVGSGVSDLNIGISSVPPRFAAITDAMPPYGDLYATARSNRRYGAYGKTFMARICAQRVVSTMEWQK